MQKVADNTKSTNKNENTNIQSFKETVDILCSVTDLSKSKIKST